MLKKVVVALLACVVSLTAGPALGITYGELDGNRHPAVGAMIRLRPSDNTLRLVCSGSLISPTVFSDSVALHFVCRVDGSDGHLGHLRFDLRLEFEAASWDDAHEPAVQPEPVRQPGHRRDRARQAREEDHARRSPPAGLLDQMKARSTLRLSEPLAVSFNR